MVFPWLDSRLDPLSAQLVNHIHIIRGRLASSPLSLSITIPKLTTVPGQQLRNFVDKVRERKLSTAVL